MKSILKDIIWISIIIILGIFIVLNIKEETPTFIKNRDDLYEKAISYLIEKNKNPDRKKQYYKLFIHYEPFGTAKDSNYLYAYMWIVTDSYYVKNNKLQNSGGNSIPYRFTFNKKGKVIKYEVPEDGRSYDFSINYLFPKEIHKKIRQHKTNVTNIEKQVDDYYKTILEKE